MWNKGIATEACKKIIEYARKTYDGNKILGTCAVENIASCNIIKKLGMCFTQDSEYSKFDGSQTFIAKTYEMKF